MSNEIFFYFSLTQHVYLFITIIVETSDVVGSTSLTTKEYYQVFVDALHITI